MHNGSCGWKSGLGIPGSANHCQMSEWQRAAPRRLVVYLISHRLSKMKGGVQVHITCVTPVWVLSACALWLVGSVWWRVERMLIWMPDLGQWPLLTITGQLRLVNLSQSGVASGVESTTEQHHIHHMEQWFLPGCTTGWPTYTWLLSMHRATHTQWTHIE